MNHFGTSIKTLTSPSKSNSSKLCTSISSNQIRLRIQIRNMTTKTARNPFNATVFFHFCTLSIQVIHILRPVLNSRITQMRSFFHKKFNSTCMQISLIIFWSRTSFNKMQICPFINNNKSVFKLSRTFCI